MRIALIAVLLLFTVQSSAQHRHVFVSILRSEGSVLTYYTRNIQRQVVFTINHKMDISTITCVKVIDLNTGRLWAQRFYSLDMSKSKEWSITFIMRYGVEV